MNRTLNLQYLIQCYLSPFSHAWPAHRSYLLSCKVSASSTISGSHCTTLACSICHTRFYTMPSRPPNSPFISTIHSLPYLILLRDTYHRIGCSSPSFLRRHDSRRCLVTNSLLPWACSCLAHPAWETHCLLSVSCPPLPSPWAMAHAAAINARMTGALTSNELPFIQPDRKSTV